MSRKSRVLSSLGIYHITVRGNNCQQIFEDDQDCLMFLAKIGEKKKKYFLKVYALCIMGDHIHLLIHVDEAKGGLSKIMKQILSEFVAAYNKKYNRVGHLFQGRFGSTPIEDTDYFMKVIQYIHRNPITAGMEKKVGDYIWNSICIYQNETNAQIRQNWRILDNWVYEGQCIIDTDLPIQIFGSNQNLLEFCQQDPKAVESYGYTGKEKESGIVVTFDNGTPVTSYKLFGRNDMENRKMTALEKDALARKIIFQISGCADVSQFQKLSIADRRKYIPRIIEKGIGKNRMVRLCGIAPKTYDRYQKVLAQASSGEKH